MTNTTKINRAEKAITEMPWGFWMNARDLAKSARLGVGTMTKYLMQARKRGLVENKQVAISSSRARDFTYGDEKTKRTRIRVCQTHHDFLIER